MNRYAPFFAPLFLALVLLQSGCIPILAGGAAGFSVAYVAGELQTHEEVPLDDAWLATRRALEALELKITDDQKDALSAKIIARGSEDKKVTVHLDRKSERVTVLTIRVGLLGDQAYSLTILDKIEEELGLNQLPPTRRLPGSAASGSSLNAPSPVGSREGAIAESNIGGESDRF